MAAGDLTTLANVQQYSNVGAGVDTALLTRMITALSAFVQSYLGRTIASGNYTDTKDGLDTQRVLFSNYPVSAVSAVLVDGLVIPAATVPVKAGWTGYVWTPTQIALQGYSFTRGYSNVSLSYTAGFAATPPDLEEAVLEIIDLRYKQRDRTGYVSKSIGGETVTFFIKDMPASAVSILEQYVMRAPL
jgi:hypothetical protein